LASFTTPDPAVIAAARVAFSTLAQSPAPAQGQPAGAAKPGDAELVATVEGALKRRSFLGADSG
jgi:hypothetical protein